MRRMLADRLADRAGRALADFLAPVIRVVVTYLMWLLLYVIGEDRAIRFAVWCLRKGWPDKAAELDRDLSEGSG